MSGRQRTSTIAALVLFSSSLALYLWLAPSLAHQHWDSLNYGWAVELEDVRALWGNHPLGHLLQQGLYQLAQAAGYAGRALPLLQVSSAICTAAAFALFFRFLTDTFGMPTLRAVGWCMAAGFSYTTVRLAGTADIYGFALLVHVMALGAIARLAVTGGRRLALGAGALIGIAGLAHQFSAVLLAAAVAALWRRDQAALWWRVAAAAAVTVVAGYASLGYLARSTLAPGELYLWARGYGGDPTYGRFISIEGLQVALGTAAQSVLRSWSRALTVWRVALVTVAAAVLIRGVLVAARAADSPRARVARAALVQFAVGAALILWWEPGNIKFWILVLPAAVIVMDAGLPAIRAAAIAPVLIGCAMLAYNVRAGVLAERRPDAAFEQNLQAIVEATSANDLIFENHEFTAHLLYWGHRPNTANVYRLIQSSPDPADPFQRVRERIDATWRAGDDVVLVEGLSPYYTDERLAVVGTSREAIDAFFRTYRWSEPLLELSDPRGGPPRLAVRLLPPDAGDGDRPAR